MVRHPAGETITVTRRGAETPGEVDTQGNPVFEADTTFTISEVAVAPTGSTETADSPGIFVLTGYDLYCPYDAPALLETDSVSVRGIPGWQVTGETAGAGWRNPFNGETPGVVVNVRRAS